MKKVLINHTNHPSARWEEKQKEGWDRIIDIPFPEVQPELSTEEVADKLVKPNLRAIVELAKQLKREGYEVYLMLQGEYTYCYLFSCSYLLFFNFIVEDANNILDKVIDAIAIPTTRRVY
ncbi:hypothetical protein [Hydrogenobacter thermophilus]|uniref:hypothetical protein n=1 Tax=Hydrogenobacter thermophilus TaxID=940 RepID=UPI0030FBE500